jgi:2-keto-3-deoxy-L-fuconate dehydrogenase
MTNRLAGKTALITAAAQGIGRACAEAFAAEGAEVLATDINATKLAELDNVSGITTRRLDVLDPAAIQALAAEIAAPAILLNCAGFVHHGSILEATEEQWEFGFDLNVRSQFRMIKAFLPGMIAAGGGSIINIASVSGSISGVPVRLVYGATKAAVIGLTKSVARDFIGQGIRCNAIAPGTVQSPSLNDRINAFADPVQARKDFIARQPLGRLGEAREIAALAVYLAGDESAYTTGSIMVSDGGLTL